MAPTTTARKRKANARDSAASAEAALVPGLENGAFEDEYSSAEDSDPGFASEDAEIVASDDDSIESDDVPSLGPSTSKSKLNGSDNLVEVDDDDETYDTSLRPFKVTQDANGNPRYLYDEIDPHYDSDDSDAPDAANTIGNIPLSFYDSYPHIGYDIDGKRVMRPAKGSALDTLLDSIEIPQGWTGLTDPATGKPLNLNDEELEVLKRLTRGEPAADGYDPYPEMVEYFTGKVETMPLSAAPEPKRRFIPSKHESRRVMKMVRAIKEGRIQPYKPPEERDQDDGDAWNFDVWADEAPRPDHVMNVPAPKLLPPGYEQSYHPPPEYVPDEQERKEWEEQDEEDRDQEYMPTDYNALRKVPGYGKLIKEKFERCLDLYLAPRVRKSKLDVDPEDLLPKLPSPDELRPFPSRLGLKMVGHTGPVRSVSFHPSGAVFASGGDDGTVRVWSCDSSVQIWGAKLSSSDPVHVVRWRPVADTFVLAASTAEHVFLCAPDLGFAAKSAQESLPSSRDILIKGFGPRIESTTEGSASPGRWVQPESKMKEKGVLVQLIVRAPVRAISWHRRGDHFSTVSPRGQKSALAIHTLSKHMTQLPLKSLKGYVQTAQFHPSKPILFVASQHSIRSYDLAKQQLLKVLQPGAKWISSFDVHPGGDNVVVSSYDKRLLWMDMDLSNKPYKTFRFHTRGVRAAKFHQGGLPLFGDASDDGSIQVFHGKVMGDLMENASIVPLTVLRGHKVTGSLGVMDLDWHPDLAYCVSGGADGTCRLWV